MSDKKNIIVNTAPSLTWNWLKSNCDTLELDLQLENQSLTVKNLPEGISTTTIDSLNSINFPESAIFNIPNPKFGDEVKTPQNQRVTDAAKTTKEDLNELLSAKTNPQVFTISGKVSNPLILNLNTEKNTVSTQLFYAKENSEATLIFVYSGNPETSLIQTKLFAESYAKVHIVKVQLFGNKTTQLDDTQVICNDNAEVQFTQIELGGSHIDSGIHTTLSGFQSKFVSNVAYLCKENQYLDMNHIVYHLGKKTECNMKVNGTLKDNACKTYRGTIDFKKNCSGSKGNEMEETLLLSPKAINKSLPVILCDEEDVEGEHGATIGKLSKDILFYMESRGIDETTAEEILSRAKIQATADLIPDDEIKDLIINFIDKL